MERAIVKFDDGKGYGFYDDPEWGVDYKKEEVEGVVDIEKEVGYHECIKSYLYDDLADYVDAMQDEENLPEDGIFIVTYFKQIPNDFSRLEQRVDFGISKKQIIANVIAQKYIEGADYFLMEQLDKIA